MPSLNKRSLTSPALKKPALKKPALKKPALSGLNPLLERLIARIEGAAGLDPWAKRAAGLLAKPLSSPAVRTTLSGTRVGHPVHPALVATPLGAWLAAGYLDLCGGAASRPAARRLIGFGALSVIPAAATGANDWSYTTGAERRVGFVHAASNYLSLALYVGSWAARRNERHRLGQGLAAAGLTVVGSAAWLGGHLAYARGVGVDTTAFQVAPTDWCDVLRQEELAIDEPKLVHADGVPVLLVATGDSILALADRCTHRGAPLHEGTLQDGCIRCPWHASVFDVRTGQVVEGPASRPQPVYEVRTRLGSVQVRRREDPGSLRTEPVS
ncbi:MAG: putative iron-sulfur protein [Frankiales bacterium]|jgi:nitrite reductase/ring-hydroxylating ferredoxin subunit/uncharacterized membrane protein|nr:putative iron-sulfur protein [Frankiales bacterium]